MTGIATCREVLIFFNYCLCGWKKGNLGLGIGFLPIGENPKIAIDGRDLGPFQFLHIGRR